MSSFFRPFGAFFSFKLSHGLRRGLYSFAASRLRADGEFIAVPTEECRYPHTRALMVWVVP